MAIVVAAFLGLLGSHATALSLGRITVQSALGEPLRAEIDMPDINAEEAASLKASVALPETFRSSGLDFNPALAGLQATLQKRADGRSFIRLSSNQPINDPFVDLILEVNWASGRLLRDYTLLLDPPSLRQGTQTAATEPNLSQVPAAPALGRVAAPPPVTTPSPAIAASRVPTRDVPARQSAPKAPTPPALVKTATPKTRQVSVRSGDTASKIAATSKPTGISLDQMLVALLRANPDAFMDNNVNRIKAGAVMNVPTAEQAGTTPATEATQIIFAQSKDFNNFRRKLAGNVPLSQVEATDRKTSGKVQATLQDQKPLTAASDKLTLSKSASPGQLTEDQLAQERSAKAAAKRAAEIAKNISELRELGSASGIAAAGLTASAATSASPTVKTASSPSANASTPKKLPVPMSSPETGLINELTENPLFPAGAIGLIILLAGLGIYRARQRKNATRTDRSFLEGHVRSDSFFAASGGESVDTNESPATGPSMVYSPTRPDAAQAVDPVAEAGVYMAHGRDLQAEEILKDALRSTPQRIVIHQKLLEIYAKRRDPKGFGEIAREAFKLTRGDGPQWQQICELGLSLDPDNAFYQPGGQPSLQTEATLPLISASDTAPSAENVDLLPTPVSAPTLAAPTDLDLDLDFSLHEEPTRITATTKATEVDLLLEPVATLAVGAEVKAPTAQRTGPDLSLLEFDLGSLSLELEPPAPVSVAATHEAEDPLATKLALAQEFLGLGDNAGARVLLEEVIAEASGDLKTKAQNALKSL